MKHPDEADANSIKPEHKDQKGSLKPAILLFFLAPLFGEYLLGNLKFSELIYLPFIAPLYGGGALLIREIARRAGRGYAFMLLLGVAYALIEEGLVDQMLFNPFYFVGQSNDTVITALGIDVWLTIIVLAMHAVWSTCIPIVLVEALFPRWGTKPWLSQIGLSFTSVIFILGSVYLSYTIYLEENFFASVPQLMGTVAAIVALVATTFRVGRQTKIPIARYVPNPWIAGVFSLATSSLFMLTDMLSGWTKVGVGLLLAFGFFKILYLWSHRISWTTMHRLAIAGGGILTYAWLGVSMEPESGPKVVSDYFGSAIIVCIAVGLLTLAAVKLWKSQLNSQDSE